jgi:hypothetical protein
MGAIMIAPLDLTKIIADDIEIMAYSFKERYVKFRIQEDESGEWANFEVNNINWHFVVALIDEQEVGRPIEGKNGYDGEDDPDSTRMPDISDIEEKDIQQYLFTHQDLWQLQVNIDCPMGSIRLAESKVGI